MQQSNNLDVLKSQIIINELHHLLWVEPFYNKDLLDWGFNCRDHSLIMAMISKILGYETLIFNGKLLLICGERINRRQKLLQIQPHTWFMIEQKGVFDFCLKPQLSYNDIIFDFHLKAIFQNQWVPNGLGNVYFVRNTIEYNDILGRVTSTLGKSVAIYSGETSDKLLVQMLKESFDYINSPLSITLSNKFDNSIYSKIILHIHDILLGGAKSLCTMSQEEAWKTIDLSYTNAIEEVVKRASLISVP